MTFVKMEYAAYDLPMLDCGNKHHFQSTNKRHGQTIAVAVPEEIPGIRHFHNITRTVSSKPTEKILSNGVLIIFSTQNRVTGKIIIQMILNNKIVKSGRYRISLIEK